MSFPIDAVTLLAFLPAALALNFTPGADMMLCIGQGLRGGARAAIWASFGVSVGGMIHACIAGLGLGALMASLPWLFDAVRWLGAGYLLWLAYKTLRGTGGTSPQNVDNHAFREGLLVNLTNPKVILFVLAFIPQFVDPTRPVLAQFLAFGFILAIGGLILNAAAGIFAISLGRKLGQTGSFSRVLNRISATIFTALAVRLVIMERN